MSLVECGHGDRLAFRTLLRILEALDADAFLNVRWRGGELDRVLDEGHATLASILAERLIGLGWDVRAEVTYAIGHDRGSIDLLALHPARRAIAVIEVKTDIASAEATLRRHDEKGRLGAHLALERFGWVAAHVSLLLVAPATSTTRRRIGRFDALFRSAYPVRGARLLGWLRDPVGSIGGLLLIDLSITKHLGSRRELAGRRRVRKASPPAPSSAARSYPRRSTAGRRSDEPPAGRTPTILVDDSRRGRQDG